MQRVVSKLRTALANPRAALPYVRSRLRVARGLAALSRYRLASLYVADLLGGTDRFESYVRANEGDRYPELDVLDFRMRVDALDEGLSRELLRDGVREPLATEAYRRELTRLESERGPLTVVDAGANIGYFALQYPALSRYVGGNGNEDEHVEGDGNDEKREGGEGEVIAVEPLPSNAALLEGNVALNGFEESVSCHRCAVGSSTTRTTMHVSTHSNWGTVGDTMGMDHFVDEIEVPVWRLDDLLRDRAVPLDSVDAVRMDVQGYEYEVVRGMADLLDRGDLGLLFLEIHPWYLRETGEYDAFLSTLEAAGFEPVFVADGRTGVLRSEKASYTERELDVDSLDELRSVDFTTEVVLRAG
ncbi:FkbM family methyltransferase [Halosimplex rubrum]|uniref:FkbM family methyltransferase n=1 Tax=Halosimplex rubrum TaxID=869889 RepID=A0A7D5P026_9EURY|nr:FkbM family methyltransferase [Halosimplex rubrum]QLH77297.1 FkbM family methyltransferase [Halosimplex rubrum]